MSRSTIDARLVSDDLGSERLREATDGLTQETLEELDDRAGEVESLGLVDDVLSGEFVGDEELGKVTDDLGGGSNLDDVSTEEVGVDVGFDDFFPLSSETELLRLEPENFEVQGQEIAKREKCRTGHSHQVGVLSSRHLMLEDTRVGAKEISRNVSKRPPKRKYIKGERLTS